MKRLIILAVIAYAGWYGWNHRDLLLKRGPAHHAVVRNDTGETIVRLRVSVGGQTFVKDELDDGQTVDFPFRVNNDSSFEVTWEWDSRQGEGHWTGGTVTAGPVTFRHILTLRPGPGVIYETQNL